MSTPGYGATARIVSPTSGREWYGEVLVWGPKGEPFLRDAETAEVRWFPASWVAEVAEANEHSDFDPGPCPCPDPVGPVGLDDDLPTDRACPHHGDPEHVASLILQKARSRT